MLKKFKFFFYIRENMGHLTRRPKYVSNVWNWQM